MWEPYSNRIGIDCMVTKTQTVELLPSENRVEDERTDVEDTSVQETITAYRVLPRVVVIMAARRPRKNVHVLIA